MTECVCAKSLYAALVYYLLHLIGATQNERKAHERCLICGDYFKPDYGNRKYCQKCRNSKTFGSDQKAVERKMKPSTKEQLIAKCQYCGNVFVVTHGKQRYCTTCRQSPSIRAIYSKKKKEADKNGNQA